MSSVLFKAFGNLHALKAQNISLQERGYELRLLKPAVFVMLVLAIYDKSILYVDSN